MANEVIIRVVLTLMVMAGWHTEMLDVKGAFLHGEFENEEKVYIKIPQGFKNVYGAAKVLPLLKTIYRLKQATTAFWKHFLDVFTNMNFKQN